MLTIYHAATESTQHRPLPDVLSEEQAQGIVHAIIARLQQFLVEQTPVSELVFSVRAANVLRNHHIRTLGELSRYDGELKGAGSRSAEEYRREFWSRQGCRSRSPCGSR